MEDSKYYNRLAVACIRGYSARTGLPAMEEPLKNKPLDKLSEEETDILLSLGKTAGLKLYRFNKIHSDMPRVKRVLGFLKGIEFESLLDVGSGRGVFLFPFLREFPGVSVTSIDILPYRVEFLQDISRGGVTELYPVCADISDRPLPEKSVDVVTMLEVLEHIPDAAAAIEAAVRMAKKFIVVTVPSKPDNNPEHIHLLTKEILTEYFTRAGCTRLRFDGVTGHLILVAAVS